MTGHTDQGPHPLEVSLRRTLSAWTAPSPEQEGLREDFLSYLVSHPNGWSRECAGAHFTASSLISSPSEEQVLLTLHARIRRWLQTGGHLEPADASLEAAALREAVEESGLKDLRLDPLPLLLSKHPVQCGGRPAEHLDVQYLVVVPQLAPPDFGAESVDVRWFGVTELPEVDRTVRDLVAAATVRLGLP